MPAPKTTTRSIAAAARIRIPLENASRSPLVSQLPRGVAVAGEDRALAAGSR